VPDALGQPSTTAPHPRLAAISTTPRPTANAKSSRTSKNVPRFFTIVERILYRARLSNSFFVAAQDKPSSRYVLAGATARFERLMGICEG
jgi:hypothetical protein